MPEPNVAVVVFADRFEAKAAWAALSSAGFNEDSLSLVCRKGLPLDNAEAYSVFFLPDVGEIFVVGPMEAWLIAVMANATMFGELSAFGAGLYTIGVSRRMAMQYEAELRANKYLLIANGSTEDVTRAVRILNEPSRTRTASFS
jgi:hypothetical protein